VVLLSWPSALVFGIKQIRKHPRGRYYFDAMLLKLPIIGILLRKIAVARFTRTLGTLITSGVPILEGLAITARTSGNAVLEEALMKVRKAIEEGRTIVDPLARMRRLSQHGDPDDRRRRSHRRHGLHAAEDRRLLRRRSRFRHQRHAGHAGAGHHRLLGISIGGIVISLYMPLFAMIGKLAG
jgi:type IV pilus assembly protein PilC